LGLDLRKAVKNIIHQDQSSYVSGQKKVSSEFEVYKFLVFRTTQMAAFNHTESVLESIPLTYRDLSLVILFFSFLFFSLSFVSLRLVQDTMDTGRMAHLSRSHSS
jgi:hypothetical protein